ncbi:hypothetical protein SISNIDRAFT_458341 [Sistotremastrum niveocremeum HHB9708]|uniref:Uncharacterized protein n=2 Tax=Sistotremastraceae TaxID=3402574 RepID=A0A164QVJ6_9AGAM|nr:hypothetical protein SISNIDRAFT_458341 [Sistotremastrum niveocremeum HHB9708]KZT39237.1 hypothetical protein SISSUDRAFT_1045860 [Sistotremastrum suecicum HHB10207 ss-3]
MSSRSVHGRSSSGSQDTHDSGSTPLTSAGPSLKDGSIMSDDSLLHSKIQSQGKQIEEQEAMIKTLNKQLAHCEGELQSHIDLVNTLETSLNDSERNLKKARGHANELTRDRDSLTSQLESARAELREAQREVVSTRQSIVEEKQSLEHRLTEERRAKERARAQLDTRMEELQRRKSKFACM